MNVRMVTPADGSAGVTVDWDGESQILDAGMLLDVPPGSDLETAIGTANLTPLTGQQLDRAANGTGGGWVSN
jgi:hypothetical protein